MFNEGTFILETEEQTIFFFYVQLQLIKGIPSSTASYTAQQASIGAALWSDDLDEAMSAHGSVLKRSTVKRQALQRERGLNSRHVLIKKELRVLAASPPASLVSTQRPPSPPPQARAQNVSTQIRTGDQGMRAWEEWVAGGLVGCFGEQRGVEGTRGGWGGGVCMRWELRRWEGGVVQFRHPLWGLENSVIVPVEMQHQQWTRCRFVTLWAQTRDGALSPGPFFNTSSIRVTGLDIQDNVHNFIKLHWKLYVLRINSSSRVILRSSSRLPAPQSTRKTHQHIDQISCALSSFPVKLTH